MATIIFITPVWGQHLTGINHNVTHQICRKTFIVYLGQRATSQTMPVGFLDATSFLKSDDVMIRTRQVLPPNG
jgi:hypothetical protein